jgi:hypothetical protein
MARILKHLGRFWGINFDFRASGLGYGAPLQDEEAHERYRRFRAARDHTAPPERRTWWLQRLAAASLRGEWRRPRGVLPLDAPAPGPTAPAPVHESAAVACQDGACVEVLAAPAMTDCGGDLESPPPMQWPPDAGHSAGFGGRRAAWARVSGRKAGLEATWVVDDFESATPDAGNDRHKRDRAARSPDSSRPPIHVENGKARRPVLEAVLSGTELLGSGSAAPNGLCEAGAGLSPSMPYLGAELGGGGAALASVLTPPNQVPGASESLQPDVRLHRRLSRGPGGHDFDAAAADVAEALRIPLWLVCAGLNLLETLEVGMRLVIFCRGHPIPELPLQFCGAAESGGSFLVSNC